MKNEGESGRVSEGEAGTPGNEENWLGRLPIKNRTEIISFGLRLNNGQLLKKVIVSW
jgi:hypothetical protein